MTSYDLLKASHIVAVVIWFGGMMAVALSLNRGNDMAGLLAWDRYVTTPAIVVSWALGLAMATWAGWFASRWMIAKLALVLVLSAMHGLLAGQLHRKAAHAGAASRIDERLVLGAMGVALAGIALLVVGKPF